MRSIDLRVFEVAVHGVWAGQEWPDKLGEKKEELKETGVGSQKLRCMNLVFSEMDNFGPLQIKDVVMVTGDGVRVEVKAIGADQAKELKNSDVSKMGCPCTH